jgi:hypothetical protein
MRSLPATLAFGSARDAALLLGGAALVAGAVVRLEGTGSVVGVLMSLAPLALAASTGRSFAEARRAGDLDGWEGLGRSPWTLLVPLLLGALGVGAACLVLPLPSAAAPLPPPVDPDLAAWWSSGWRGLPDGSWRLAPGELGLSDLVARLAREAPAGARRGVDGAELLRRASLAAAWPLGVLAGALGPLSSHRRGDAGTGRASLLGALVCAGWLCVGALAVGLYSIT